MTDVIHGDGGLCEGLVRSSVEKPEVLEKRGRLAILWVGKPKSKPQRQKVMENNYF